MSRDHILHKVRTALGRSAGQPPGIVPPARLTFTPTDPETRIAEFLSRFHALAGRTHRASSPEDACAYIASATAGKTAIASNAPVLRECGITSLPNVSSGHTDAAELRALCATAHFGVTGADYALAATGTLVMLSSAREARLISLLPPVHIAVVSAASILTCLDELLAILPQPAEQTSSMVLITGPSRTADIEQILVRGVHGPGEIHVVVL